ncbi:MAG: substrate-binding domain-containing protein [Pseudomonadota bacterium]|jgi:ribose transport system substrate-binding protein|uniref:Ribose ABC transporter, periplasmic ribose-binding protein RbsB n=3 Tax=Caballeronia TaxID=1827195 RepID=A0A242M758_CABSO|nr:MULTISPECIES: substrate-binding domain-containing protein [Burkholderiaceae]MDP9155977.1 substrate-binding domain-containing protein [Pseudomonadota bacterium]AMH43449.1 sugar ABC transporter substrate-binding protein [Burkholderia sp. PAMC 26561]AMM16847.1 sugar ABC transporter substrate-binding protein [Burkholderia sp. PAMC 28687]OTP67099.1 Ribose ABC transporter, periplasmic ribose-binding protein RbsB [Caballeronia sordidicola]OTP71115.1 Ribose ABC transporter, periplasmic ribose-bindi
MLNQLRGKVLRKITLGLLLTASLPALAAQTYSLILINQQATYFNQMREGAQKQADKLGAKLIVFNANDVPSAQNNALDDYIQQKVDGIAVDAIDVNGLRSSVKAAAAAGITVVGIDAVLPPGPQKAQVGVDNAVGGKLIADYLAKYVQANLGGKARVGVVGALSSTIQNSRQKASIDELAKSPGISIAGIVDGRNSQDVALSAAENLITANPDINVIYATGEPAMLGAIAAINAQGMNKKIKVVGWDLASEVIRGIDNGVVLGVVQQDPAAMGRAAIQALNDVHEGKTVQTTISVPLAVVTKANVDPYRAAFKK